MQKSSEKHSQQWFLLILVCYVAHTAKYITYLLKIADVTQIWWRHLHKRLQILAKFFIKRLQTFFLKFFPRFYVFNVFFIFIWTFITSIVYGYYCDSPTWSNTRKKWLVIPRIESSNSSSSNSCCCCCCCCMIYPVRQFSCRNATVFSSFFCTFSVDSSACAFCDFSDSSRLNWRSSTIARFLGRRPVFIVLFEVGPTGRRSRSVTAQTKISVTAMSVLTTTTKMILQAIRISGWINGLTRWSANRILRQLREERFRLDLTARRFLMSSCRKTSSVSARIQDQTPGKSLVVCATRAVTRDARWNISLWNI